MLKNQKITYGLFLIFLSNPAGAVSNDAPVKIVNQIPKQLRARTFQNWQSQVPAQQKRQFPLTREDLPVLVIGAGPAGLAAMRALKESKIPYEAVEKAAALGGVWNPANPETPAYDHLAMISSRTTSDLGEPIPKEWPTYLPLKLVHRYLTHYARKFRLLKKIQFQTEVETVRKMSDGAWRAFFRSGEKRWHREYRALVSGVGNLNKTNRIVPTRLWHLAQQSGIHTIHASEFRNNQGYEGKNVLIIGMGVSAADIATQVSKVAKRTSISVRSTPWIVPTMVFGIPTDIFAGQEFPFPNFVKLAGFHSLQRLLIGHPTSLGFPKSPGHDLLDKLPVPDRGLVKALRDHQIILRTTVKEIRNGRVRYNRVDDPTEKIPGESNGKFSEEFKGELTGELEREFEGELEGELEEDIDEIIFATGYNQNVPFLPPKYGNLNDPNFHLTLLIFHPTEPGLMFIPSAIPAQGGWPLFWEQSKAIAAYLREEPKDSARIRQFNALRTAIPPNYKGDMFSRMNDYYVEMPIYLKLLQDFTKWMSGE